MSTTTPNGENVSEEQFGGLASRLADKVVQSFTIGRDTEGRSHHYYQAADSVVVYGGDGVERREYLDGRTVAEWEAFVEQKRGWAAEGQFASIGVAADRQRKEGDE